MPAISVMIKPASGLCNFRCKYCFYADEMANRTHQSYGIMSESTLEHVIIKILEFAEVECTIAFQGGEPTLAGLAFFRKCISLVNKYNTKKIKVKYALQTNAYLIDKEWCEFFAQHHFLIGVSVDGIKYTHDTYRKDADGNDTYLHTLHAIELLKDAKIDFNILTVVNGITAAKVNRIYENYRKQGFDWQQYIACLDPIWKKQGQMDYSLTPEVYGKFLISLFHLWEIDFWKNEAPTIRQFENYIGIIMGYPPESCEHRGNCSFQTVIEADGSVYPCDFYVLDDYRIGNLNTETMEEIQKRRLEIQFVETSFNHTAECKNCKWFKLCRGGCRRHREQPGTQKGENYFCKSYQMFFEECISDMEKIAICCMKQKRGRNSL